MQTLQKLTGAPTFIAADGTVDEDAMLEYFRNKDDSLTSLPAKWTFFALSYGIVNANPRVRYTGFQPGVLEQESKDDVARRGAFSDCCGSCLLRHVATFSRIAFSLLRSSFRAAPI